jgi:AcrR family transcriptional regulator
VTDQTHTVETVGPTGPGGPNDRQAQRRAERRAANRAEILDAAEKVFGQNGLRDGSLRRIATESGFSTAAIYLFFDSKQHLVAETMTRRGLELLAAVRQAAERDEPALARLHHIVDVSVTFFDDRPHFRQLLRHLRGGATIVGPVLDGLEAGTHPTFDGVMATLTDLVRQGQEAGEVREGDPRALAHLYSVLVNEHVLLTSAEQPPGGVLTPTQFHGLIDGALRKPIPTMST